jgi:N-carbamoyl-L-amino-acid hydrolase
VFTRAFAHARQDRAGVKFGDALETIGYRGPEPCGGHKLSAFFEIHIEQGPYLEQEGKDIGVVTGVQAMRWYEATVTGQDTHAGTTPMPRRRDALVGAARMVEAVDALARKNAPYAVGTVGILEAKPGSPNVVPGEVFFTIDLRHPDMAVLNQMESDITAAANAIGNELGLDVAINNIWNQPPVEFDADCIAAIRAAAAASGFSTRDITSGAGHDAAYIARVAPTAMIFVPCRDGISHNIPRRSNAPPARRCCCRRCSRMIGSWRSAPARSAQPLGSWLSRYISGRKPEEVRLRKRCESGSGMAI